MCSSTQLAGVGGIGPNVEIGCGRRVGGDIIGSGVRLMLCDLELEGGGPGGGGGRGIPGSHLVVEADREWGEWVLIAPADTALREAGGLTGSRGHCSVK